MTDAPKSFEQLSWRDPDGFVVASHGRIFRAVMPDRVEQTKALMASKWLLGLIAESVFPATHEVVTLSLELPSQQGWLWLEHEKLPFPCYPHEITALQLYDSAALTLRIAAEAAREGWTLKDASAWNVLHSEGRAVFIDLLSFERSGNYGTWMAYGQFARHFLIPLLLYKKLGMTPAEIFLVHRDGITPEHAYRLLRGLKVGSFAGIEFVVLPTLLSRAGTKRIASDSRQPRQLRDPEVAQDILLRTLRHLQKILSGLQPDRSQSASVWEGYEEERCHYSEADIAAKREFVRSNLGTAATVLDLGCNAGEFSLIAADCGKKVVAADADHPVLSRLYARVRDQNLPVMPILLNIGRPSPAIGWRNQEVASFLDRAIGQFECVLMLGLLHHLLVRERMTLGMLIGLLDGFKTKRVIVEWIEPNDPKFMQLSGLDRPLYSNLTAELFESEMEASFRLVAKMRLPCATRLLYVWDVISLMTVETN